MIDGDHGPVIQGTRRVVAGLAIQAVAGDPNSYANQSIFHGGVLGDEPRLYIGKAGEHSLAAHDRHFAIVVVDDVSGEIHEQNRHGVGHQGDAEGEGVVGGDRDFDAGLAWPAAGPFIA